MDGYSFLSSDEDSDSEWVNIHRLNKAVVDSALNSEENLLSSPTGQSTYPTTADSSREIIQPKQPSSEQSPAENSSQQTRSGRLWSSVPSFGVWVATAGVQGDQKSVDAGALDDTMATNQADEQKKPGWLKRKKLAAAEVMQRVKTTWKSEEETEDVGSINLYKRVCTCNFICRAIPYLCVLCSTTQKLQNRPALYQVAIGSMV